MSLVSQSDRSSVKSGSLQGAEDFAEDYDELNEWLVNESNPTNPLDSPFTSQDVASKTPCGCTAVLGNLIVIGAERSDAECEGWRPSDYRCINCK